MSTPVRDRNARPIDGSAVERGVKPDPISLDISPANGGMSGNQGGWDESEAPEGEAGGQ